MLHVSFLPTNATVSPLFMPNVTNVTNVTSVNTAISFFPMLLDLDATVSFHLQCFYDTTTVRFVAVSTHLNTPTPFKKHQLKALCYVY